MLMAIKLIASNVMEIVASSRGRTDTTQRV